MSYSLASAITQVRSIINEPVALIIDDAEITQYLHFATRIASALTLCNMESEGITVVENDFQYSTTKEFIKIEHVTYDIEGGDANGRGPYALQRISLKGIGNVCAGTASIPRFYAVWGTGSGSATVKNIIVWPICQIPVAGVEKITVTGYVPVVAYASDGSTMPSYLHYPCINYALSCCHAKQGGHQLAAMYMKQFLADCSFYRREIYDWRRSVDSKDMTKVPDITRFATTG
jgi:hypothetical protein